MQLQFMSSAEMEAVYAYAAALLAGRVKPPEGVVVSDTLEGVIKSMIMMKMTLGELDHNSVLAVKREFGVLHPGALEAALQFTPTARYRM